MIKGLDWLGCGGNIMGGSNVLSVKRGRCRVLMVTDDELLERIKIGKDRSACEELYQRYSQPAHNLALYLTHNREAAEEAVQEAFLEIWRTHSFVKLGSARSWILRIVSTKCFKALRKKGYATRHEKAAGQETQADWDPATDGEPQEMRQALRAGVNSLSVDERRMVALYYGSGWSQDEIAKAMRVPARTISSRLQHVLQELKKSLARSGFAGVNAEAFSGELNHVVLHSFAASPSLDQKVFEDLDQVFSGSNGQVTGNQSAHAQSVTSQHSGNSRTGRSWSLGLALTVSCAVALAVASKVRSDTESSISDLQQKQSAKNVDMAPALPSPADEKFRHIWRFDKGAPNDLDVLKGAWRLRSGRGGQANTMVPDVEKGVDFLLPIRMPKGPVLVQVKANLLGARNLHTSSLLEESKIPLGKRVWFNAAKFKPYANQKVVYQNYYFDRFKVLIVNGKVSVVHEYVATCPGHRILISATLPGGIEEIEVRTLEASEIPVFMRDPMTLAKSYTRYDPDKHVFGAHQLPMPSD